MRLELTHSQKQMPNHRMQLSVKILQMNAQNLEQYICQCALENPLIELEPVQEADDSVQARLKRLEWLDSIDESNSYQYPRPPETEQQEIPLSEKHVQDSLLMGLIAQLPDFHLTKELEQKVRYIIENLDENGYLPVPHNELLQKMRVNETQLQAALSIIHQMDPPGVGAANLQQCLLIQAERMTGASTLLIKIITDHLDDLSRNQLGKLAHQLQVSIEEIKEAYGQLLKLNPKPGNGYSSYQAIPYIRPDLFVIRFEKGFQIFLNDFRQPRIEISSYYRSIAKDAESDVASYISDKLEKAEWLISCINQRKKTIVNCAGSILQRQIRFFEHGPGNLVPMILADVASDLNVHPSTVSRAVRDKYLQCQWGVFALSDFFTREINESGSQSQDMVLMQIKRIIAEESPTKPLSDEAITRLLQQRNITIARRTVAKYREQMRIPSASRRKQY